MSDWLIYLLVWLTAFLNATSATPEPAPVAATTTTTTVTTTTSTVVPDHSALVDLHTRQLRDFHVAYEASVFAYSAHGSSSVVDWLHSDLDKMRWWQAEWQAAGAPDRSVSDEYADVIARHQALVDRIENDHE